MISICRELSRGRNQKKKFRPWLNFSNPSPAVTSIVAAWKGYRDQNEVHTIRPVLPWLCRAVSQLQVEPTSSLRYHSTYLAAEDDKANEG